MIEGCRRSVGGWRRLLHPAGCSPARLTSVLGADGRPSAKELSYIEVAPLPVGHMVSTCTRCDVTHANGDLMHGPHHPGRSNDDDPPNQDVAGDGSRTF